MGSDWTITKEDFDSLLLWLDLDRERAGMKYEQLRRSLIQIFIWRGLSDAEDLADETINRVARRVNEIAAQYVGDPSAYFYGVAKKLIYEAERRQRSEHRISSREILVAPESTDVDKSELRIDCLNRCLKELSAPQRQLFLSYYSAKAPHWGDHRQKMAKRLNVDVNALRVRMYRIRLVLEKCIEKCISDCLDL